MAWTEEEAPEKFNVRFETSKGTIDFAVQRSWSPEAADRFYQLVRHNYFEGSVFYRVIPEFVAQFGSGDSVANSKWAKYRLKDEPVVLGNRMGTISFARSGPNTRGGDLFINLMDNPRLDTLTHQNVVGFPAFGKVTVGIDVVKKIYSGYTEAPAKKLDLLYSEKAQFFEEFPKLDTIKKAYLLE